MLHYDPQRFEQHAAHPQEDKLYHHSLWYRHPLQTLYSMQVESGLQSALHLHTVWQELCIKLVI